MEATEPTTEATEPATEDEQVTYEVNFAALSGPTGVGAAQMLHDYGWTRGDQTENRKPSARRRHY